MAKNTLPVDFKDDIMNSSMGGKRRYRVINNSDGTISLEDATTYDQVGSNFGAGQMNATNEAVNASADAGKIIDDIEAIRNVTKEGYMAGALALKQVDNSLEEQPTFAYDENGKIIGYMTKIGGADTVFPFSSVDKDVLYTNTATYLDSTVTVTTDMTQYDLIVVELYNSTSQYHSFIKSGANWSIGVNMNGGASTYRVIHINDTSINIYVYNVQANWGAYNVPRRIIGLKNVFKVIND